MKEKLTFISASAGTGKTYRLVQEVKAAITEGTARPSGVMATTFTRVAANELKERLAAAFHDEGLHDEALGLEDGWITTVHGLGFQLLSRFAFEAGVSPEIRIIDDTEAALLLDRAIDEVVDEDVRQELYGVASRLGQRDERSGQWRWRKVVKDIVGNARSNDIAFEQLPAMGVASWLEMKAEMPAATEANLNAQLAERIRATLEATADSSKKNTKKYRDLLRTFLQRMDDPSFAWSNWAKLHTTRPEVAFNADAEAVDEVASRVAEHPCFQDDISRYLERLFSLASQVGNRFTELKRERGAADYSDLEKDALDLLRGQSGVREILASEIDLLLVDEFQDTSPIQLALFVELGKLANRVIWVGDVKQSIYGFRKADPELVFRAVSGAGASGSLETSWRSVPDLVDVTNRLFAPAFNAKLGLPEEQTTIDPHRSAAADSPPAIGLAQISSGEKYGNGNSKPLSGRRPYVMADAVEQLLADADERVTEKSSITVSERVGQSRPLKQSDIAVLARKGSTVSAIAAALRARGHDVLISGAGLLGTPEAALALACLRRFLDPADSLAAVEVVALEALHEVEEWLEHRLRYVQEQTEAEALDPWLLESSPALKALHSAANPIGDRANLSPLSAFDAAIRAADVAGIISRWGPTPTRAKQRLAGLAKLRSFLEDYETRSAQFGLPATINGLFGWLDDLAESGEDSFPKLATGDAIHVGTYHSAKGLEWPVVFLADLDWEPRSSLFNLRVTDPVSGELDFENPLGGRELRLWIHPFGGKQKHPLMDQLEASPTGQRSDSTERNEALRLLYVGFTRARDRLILLHEPLAKPPAWLRELGEPAATALTTPAENMNLPPGDPIPLLSRLHEYSDQSVPATPAATLDLPIRADSQTRRALASLIPSSQPPIEGASVVEVIEFGRRLELTGHPNERDLGDALHRILATEILNPDATGHPSREDRAAAILRAYGLEQNLALAEVLGTVDRYNEFIRARYQPVSEQVEVPFTVPNHQGQRLSGYIDHWVKTANGSVVVDHKIFPGRRNEWEPRALSYSGQLASYRQAVGGEPLLAIHLVTLGALVIVDVPAHSRRR